VDPQNDEERVQSFPNAQLNWQGQRDAAVLSEGRAGYEVDMFLIARARWTRCRGEYEIDIEGQCITGPISWEWI